jgi:hypothetical protein
MDLMPDPLISIAPHKEIQCSEAYLCGWKQQSVLLLEVVKLQLGIYTFAQEPRNPEVLVFVWEVVNKQTNLFFLFTDDILSNIFQINWHMTLKLIVFLLNYILRFNKYYPHVTTVLISKVKKVSSITFVLSFQLWKFLNWLWVSLGEVKIWLPFK